MNPVNQIIIQGIAHYIEPKTFVLEFNKDEKIRVYNDLGFSFKKICHDGQTVRIIGKLKQIDDILSIALEHIELRN